MAEDMRKSVVNLEEIKSKTLKGLEKMKAEPKEDPDNNQSVPNKDLEDIESKILKNLENIKSFPRKHDEQGKCQDQNESGAKKDFEVKSVVEEGSKVNTEQVRE